MNFTSRIGNLAGCIWCEPFIPRANIREEKYVCLEEKDERIYMRVHPSSLHTNMYIFIFIIILYFILIFFLHRYKVGRVKGQLRKGIFLSLSL